MYTPSIIYIIVLLVSVVLHEVAHGYTAYKLGDPTAKIQGRLSLNPMVHLDIMGSLIVPAFLVLTGSPFIFGWAKPVPINPYNFKSPKWGGALTAVMGPITNMLIALLAALFLAFASPSEFVGVILQNFIITNIVLAVFNLFPIPPLDGYHILFALIPDSLNQLKDQIKRLALPILLIFIFFGWRIIEPVVFYLYKLLQF